MKKNLFFVALAAIALASCSSDDVLVDENVAQENQTEIGFSTFANSQTRAADNSSSATLKALDTHHTSFDVWGYKTVNSTESNVFVQQQVNYASSAWSYTPARYWDKSATKYEFYAAAPHSANWSISSKKLTYSGLALTGATLAEVEYAKNAVDANASFNSVEAGHDLMISHDITNHTDYTGTKVNLEFDHILSRLNIGVAKKAGMTEDVYLNSITLYNHMSTGTFTESTSDAINTGSIARWASSVPYTSGVGYTEGENVSGYKLPDAASKYAYVYQSLIIPQTMSYETDIKLDGSNIVAASSKPYLKLVYTIKYSDDAYETFTYYYNIADMFNGSESSDVTFYEGWQNNLNITISPTKIDFDAQVYEWVNKTNSDVNVTE